MNLDALKKVLAFLCLFTTTVVYSQDTQNLDFQKEADQFFADAVNKLGIPGLSVVIIKDDQTILAEGYGYADFENQVLANENTNYYIASTTKSFTALLATILDDEGIIKLEDPLRKYFSNLKLDSGIDLDSIKIKDLFTHTSGIDNEPIGWRVAFSGEHDQQTLLDLMEYCVPNEVGSGHYKYTNIGYNIYALILEKETGKSWQNWMQEKIFTPAEMNHTTAFISKAEKEKWSVAKPYMVLDSTTRIQLEKKDNTMQSAGGLIITPQDMTIWLKLQLGKGKLNNKQIIAEDLIVYSQQKLVPVPETKRIFQPSHYGMGWLHGTYETEEVIHHFGGFAGFSTHVSFIPDKQIGVAVMVNEALVGNQLMNLIATYIYDHFLEKGTATDYEKQLNAFVQKVTQVRGQISGSIAKRNEREWLLSHELEDYTGQYISEEYGTLSIMGNPQGLNVEIGNMQSESTPFTNQESIRVELIPGSGQVIQFVTEGQKIVGLKYDGIDFKKI